ncbi:hypothetical protein B0H15DRAFT_65404 [Mycena belliarum]|uniref:Zn(2)-C6 fungal-type domain-containing protein n=1 Tax=Mycena belliarum TaxID=1033014 RepID=A0AAD6TR63_9AGAR|nr:hypothetical protein B0H15DRAFT_65404 [Mycena belliae]
MSRGLRVNVPGAMESRIGEILYLPAPDICLLLHAHDISGKFGFVAATGNQGTDVQRAPLLPFHNASMSHIADSDLLTWDTYITRSPKAQHSFTMAPPQISSKKALAKATPTTDGDHRKRRRNRTTQSCLNCHTTKRMCDRKRPCSRCSQLGLSGNCVYEVDDPKRQAQPDESARLINRIAELEGVIRELKNKPHPRWLAEQDRPAFGSDSHPSPPSSAGPPTPKAPIWAFPSSPRNSGSQSPSQITGPTSLYGSDSLESLFSAYTGLTDHIVLRRSGICGCLNETVCYNVVLELSIRLRKAADVMARSPSHSINSSCALQSYIMELDTFVKDSLLSVPSRSIEGSTSPVQDKYASSGIWMTSSKGIMTT